MLFEQAPPLIPTHVHKAPPQGYVVAIEKIVYKAILSIPDQMGVFSAT